MASSAPASWSEKPAIVSEAERTAAEAEERARELEAASELRALLGLPPPAAEGEEDSVALLLCAMAPGRPVSFDELNAHAATIRELDAARHARNATTAVPAQVRS